MVVHRHDLPDTLGRIIRLLMHRHSAVARSGLGETAVPPVGIAPPPVSRRVEHPVEGEDVLKDAAE